LLKEAIFGERAIGFIGGILGADIGERPAVDFDFEN